MKNITSIKIPKKYQERVQELYYDSDGYWLHLNKGWHWDDYGLHTIHEDTKSRVLMCLRDTEPCDCDYCKGLEN